MMDQPASIGWTGKSARGASHISDTPSAMWRTDSRRSHLRATIGVGDRGAKNLFASIPGQAKKYATLRARVAGSRCGHQVSHLQAKKIAAARSHMNIQAADRRVPRT